MSLWRGLKPAVCKVQGYAVGGGSDIALACDLVVMAEDARIGYPPARVWGIPTTAMWVYRLGPERAKRMLLTGDDPKVPIRLILSWRALRSILPNRTLRRRGSPAYQGPFPLVPGR
mgnify:CR=1 FL=1